jgi:hypothetical protein
VGLQRGGTVPLLGGWAEVIPISLPQDRAFLIDGKGLTTPPFYRWMSDGTAAIRELQAAVTALQEAVDGEDGEPVEAVIYKVVQGAGIKVSGAGTQESPWVISLRPLDNSGTGTAVYKTTIDGYGRVSGYVAANLDDLADVDAATPADGDVLTWVDADSEWQALPPASGGKAVTALSIASGVVDIDCSLGDYFTLTLTANVTSITFSNLPASGFAMTKMVRIVQGAGPYTVAWPASFKWEGGVAGTVSTANGAVDVIAITSFDQGTTHNVTLAKAWA